MFKVNRSTDILFFSGGLVPFLMKKTRGMPLPIILVKGLYEISQIPSEVNRSPDILFFSGGLAPLLLKKNALKNVKVGFF